MLENVKLVQLCTALSVPLQGEAQQQIARGPVPPPVFFPKKQTCIK